jgi:hypothetical protein
LHTAFGQFDVELPEARSVWDGLDRLLHRLRRRLRPASSVPFRPRWERRIRRLERRLASTRGQARENLSARLEALFPPCASNGALEREDGALRPTRAFRDLCRRLGTLVAAGELWNPTVRELCDRLVALRDIRWTVREGGVTELRNGGAEDVAAVSIQLFLEEEPPAVRLTGIEGGSRVRGDRLAVWVDLPAGATVEVEVSDGGVVEVRRVIP